MKYEEINVNGEQLKVEMHTAQIYNDCLYVYGGKIYKLHYDKEKALWSFDLSQKFCISFSILNSLIDTLTWKMCQSSGEIPGLSSTNFRLLKSLDFKHRRSSFILQDNLYIYAGEEFYQDAYTKDIFVLNLSKEPFNIKD